MKTEDLVKTAQELNDLLFDPPEIDVENEDQEYLKSKIVEASGLLEKDDVITKGTEEVIKKLKLEALDGDDFEDVEENVEEETKEEDNGDLQKQVMEAGKRKDLAIIAKTNDEFKQFRGIMSKFKDTESLRIAMLDILKGEGNLEPIKPAKEIKKDPVKLKQKSNDKKPTKKGPSLSSQCIEFFIPLIEKGNYTKVQLVERGMIKFPELAKSTVQTIISDGMNPKYCKFPKLIVKDESEILKFENK